MCQERQNPLHVLWLHFGFCEMLESFIWVQCTFHVLVDQPWSLVLMECALNPPKKTKEQTREINMLFELQ